MLYFENKIEVSYYITVRNKIQVNKTKDEKYRDKVLILIFEVVTTISGEVPDL